MVTPVPSPARRDAHAAASPITATRPALQCARWIWLTAIEVHVVDFVHPIEDLGYVPFHVAERVAEDRLLLLSRRITIDQLRAAYDQQNRSYPLDGIMVPCHSVV
jgi:hypothetical protein